MTVEEAIKTIIDKRKSENRIPHCAMLNEVRSLSELPDEQFKEEMEQLKKDGKIAIRQTINSSSIYLR
jgi:hypothetical protein